MTLAILTCPCCGHFVYGTMCFCQVSCGWSLTSVVTSNDAHIVPCDTTQSKPSLYNITSIEYSSFLAIVAIIMAVWPHIRHLSRSSHPGQCVRSVRCVYRDTHQFMLCRVNRVASVYGLQVQRLRPVQSSVLTVALFKHMGGLFHWFVGHSMQRSGQHRYGWVEKERASAGNQCHAAQHRPLAATANDPTDWINN